MKSSSEIRQEFIEYFKDNHKHTVVRSSPVAPLDDSTLLFTNAGMNQFKDVFIGTGSRSYTRAVNSQKIIRASGKHNDLDDVGYDTYHHTFFEMLGNWSFGDYGKKEAIKWAWELLTNQWKLNKNRLYATVYQDDQEAFDLWKTETDIKAKHILYFAAKDNFWEMGKTGPCGPCSEIHYDKGGSEDIDGSHPELGVNTDNPRFIEIWNLVFMQYFRKENGELEKLKQSHVDTGMGFERIVSILQKKNSNYDTDVFNSLLKKMEHLSGKKYNSATEIPFRIAVDHVRALAFSIADGALPSNEGRGYVLRRMLRRASRYGRTIGLNTPYLHKLSETVITQFSPIYPELKQNRILIKNVIQREEEQFNRTLDKGLCLFGDLKESLLQKKKSIISGINAFKLYDTYGFPLDLTQLLAEENNLVVDVKSFNVEMKKQKERARKSGKFNIASEDKRNWIHLSTGTHSNFKGYKNLLLESEIREYAIFDSKVYIILSDTPFYAESGGQVGDQGIIQTKSEMFTILDIQKEGDRIVHIANDTGIEPSTKKVTASVSKSSRADIASNHTSTHLMHQALKNVLGKHIQQAGSHVDANRLRFDFNHFEKISDQQISEVEKIVNQEILRNTPLDICIKSYDEAISSNVTALFGEKYGDNVRVVTIGDFSSELCGGTHVVSTGQIGTFQIVSESSIASGIRRIEAITGMKAFLENQKNRKRLKRIETQLASGGEQIIDKIQLLLYDRKTLEKKNNELNEKLILQDSESFINDITNFKGINLLEKKMDHVNEKILKLLILKLISDRSNTIIAFSSIYNKKAIFAVAVSTDLISKYHAGKLVSQMAKVVGGGGGGKPEFASAGGKNISKLDHAFTVLRQHLSE